MGKREIFDKYRRLYEDLHGKAYFDCQTVRHSPNIKYLIDHTKSKKLLDYGSGKGVGYFKHKLHETWGIEFPTLYDIAIPKYSMLPEGKFDGVICTDVLEHVPEALLDDVLDDLLNRYPKKFVYLSIATRVALNRLPNGENAHCTVHTPQWWLQKIHGICKNEKLPIAISCIGPTLLPQIHKRNLP